MHGRTIIPIAALTPASCGGDGGCAESRKNPARDGKHLWKSQTGILDKARETGDTVMNKAPDSVRRSLNRLLRLTRPLPAVS
jgi:hypothetical protein